MRKVRRGARVQGVLSRGDERVAVALDRIQDVSLAGWQHVVDLLELDVDYYVNKKWDTSQKLPWSMIDSGADDERLCGELEKALLSQ